VDSKIIQQLAELAQSFNRIGLKPVICGGLGIYLCFHQYEDEARELIRTTNDVDLMLTKTQVLEQAKRRAIAEIITGELKYSVREGREYLHFKKENDQYLDILAPPIEGFKTEGFRIKFVRSKLHGYVTDEACFIEEDLRTVSLSKFLSNSGRKNNLEVQVPSPTNSLILKLFAFNDRDQGQRQDLERAQAHAFDIFITIMLMNRADYLEGRKFLSRHEDSEIIQKAKSIVDTKFSSIDESGWRLVLESSGFFTDKDVRQKKERLEEARNRLKKWFAV
jgi:hypothetical protein